MTSLIINWTKPATKAGDLPAAQDILTMLRVSPILVSSGPMSAVVAPGEPVDFPSGEAISMTIDLPRLRTVVRYDDVPAGEAATLALDTDGVLGELAAHEILTSEPRGLRPRTSSGELPPGAVIRSVTVDVRRGLRRLAPIAASLVPRSAALQSADSGVVVSGSRPVSLAAKIASRKTLPRFMMIPYAGSAANECRIVPVTPVGASTRLRVEPADPVASLLMDYLVAGKFTLASAAARAIEKQRGDEDPAEWTRPSYCQLLIGYAYALGRDVERLERWCRRTDAAASLGTDGVVLAAEAARLRPDPDRSAQLIARAAGASPPLLVHGADIGLRVATRLLTRVDKSSWGGTAESCLDELLEVRGEFSRLLFIADGESSTLSIPASRNPMAELAASRAGYAIRQILNWLAASWRRGYSVTHERLVPKRQHLVPIGAAMASVTPTVSQAGTQQSGQQNGSPSKAAAADGGSSSTLKLSGPALWTAILALVVWVGFSVLTLFFVSKSETEWTRVAWVFGSIQSVAFAAAGALFGTAVQQKNVSNAQQDAANAKQDADAQRETAIKGRALATVLSADGTTPRASEESGLEAMGPGLTGADEPADAVRQQHARLARALFPEL